MTCSLLSIVVGLAVDVVGDLGHVNIGLLGHVESRDVHQIRLVELLVGVSSAVGKVHEVVDVLLVVIGRVDILRQRRVKSGLSHRLELLSVLVGKLTDTGGANEGESHGGSDVLAELLVLLGEIVSVGSGKIVVNIDSVDHNVTGDIGSSSVDEDVSHLLEDLHLGATLQVLIAVVDGLAKLLEGSTEVIDTLDDGGDADVVLAELHDGVLNFVLDLVEGTERASDALEDVINVVHVQRTLDSTLSNELQVSLINVEGRNSLLGGEVGEGKSGERGSRDRQRLHGVSV